jgi:DNA replication licensing factor MCM5
LLKVDLTLPPQQGGASTVPITVRQLEAIVRISESLAKMTLNSETTPEHVTEAMRLFKVSTLNAAQNDASGTSSLASLTAEQAKEVLKIEEQIQRMVAIGSVVPTKKLQDDFVLKQGCSPLNVHRALQILVSRGEFAHLNQQKHLKRLR